MWVAALVGGAVVLTLTGCTGEQPDRQATPPSATQVRTAPADSVASPGSAQPTRQPTRQPPPSASPAAPPRREVVELGPDAVAGVPMGTAALEAERRLRASLGRPTEADDLPGCNGETGRRLAWGGLLVLLAGERGDPAVLSGWSAQAGARFDYRLPFGTRLGETAAAAQRRIPRSSGVLVTEGPVAGSYVVTTDVHHGLLWIASGAAADDPVAEVSFMAGGCD